MRWMLIFIVLFSLGATGTTIYTWTDAQGRTHFSDEPPPNGVQADRLRLQGGETRRQRPPSDRVRHIRCRDFRGALEQLQAADDVRPDDARWLAAKDIARERIAQWCEGTH